MKHLNRILSAFTCLLITVVLISSCKENTLINSRVSPANNAIGVYDTFLPCITHTYYDDTVQTSANFGGIPIIQGVGTYLDPFFGSMVASTYFNILPSLYTVPDTSLIDSAVLILPYSGLTYGDTLTTTLSQTYQVFYMEDTMSYNSFYYAYNSKPIDVAHPLSAPTTINTYHLRDSFAINQLPVNHPGLRIKLNLATLYSHLLPAVALLATSSNPNQDFLNAFNGICVQLADTRQLNTAIPYFQLDGADMYSEAGIILYPHIAGTTKLDTLDLWSYYFSPGFCGHLNNVVTSYSHYPVNNLYHSTQANDQIIALQNQPGATLDIVIPGIKSLPAGIINKAELQLTLLPGYGNQIGVNGDSIMLAPERLNPTGVANSTYPLGVGAGLLYNIADLYPLYSSTPQNVIDGTLHYPYPGTSSLAKFTIDIPREVMASIAAKNDTIHLHIDGTQDFYGAFHMVAGGGSYPDSNYRAKLFVVYSKLKN